MKTFARKFLALMTAMLLLTTLTTSCGKKSSGSLTQEDLVLAGIPLGTPDSEIKKVFGEPTKILQMAVSERWSYGKSLFFEFVDGKAQYIEIFKEGATKRGLKIGDSKSKVIELYGKPDIVTPIEDGKELWIYTWEDKVDLKITVTPESSVDYIGLWTN